MRAEVVGLESFLWTAFEDAAEREADDVVDDVVDNVADDMAGTVKLSSVFCSL